ncbi:MAG: hypothetical protein KAI43_03620 [Candidatus Aureabacteria bacterium]|nr:hypothetical protein [Candidatus Auribacterota bacterium]
MRKLFYFLFISLFLNPSFIYAEKQEELSQYPFKKRFLMAILPFEDKTKDKKYEYLGSRIADQIINEIFSYSRYRLIEREKLSALVDEMQVQQSEYFKKDVINKIGNQLGAELMLVGSIIEISKHTDKQSLGLISKQKTIIKISLEARVVHIATGEIIVISKWSGEEKTSKKRALIATTGDNKKEEELIADAIKKAVKKIAYQISKNAPVKTEDR